MLTTIMCGARVNGRHSRGRKGEVGNKLFRSLSAAPRFARHVNGTAFLSFVSADVAAAPATSARWGHHDQISELFTRWRHHDQIRIRRYECRDGSRAGNMPDAHFARVFPSCWRKRVCFPTFPPLPSSLATIGRWCYCTLASECSNGLEGFEGTNENGSVCCPLGCNQCGGAGCGQSGAGQGYDHTDCCINGVLNSYDGQKLCSVIPAAPCIMDGLPVREWTMTGVCFHLTVRSRCCCP